MGLMDFLRARRSSSSAAGTRDESSRAQSDASDSFTADTEAGSAQQTCPRQRSICGRFAITPVKCGSPVELQAEASNITDGTTTRFQLRSPPGRSGVGTESAPLRGGRVRGLQWTSKKPATRSRLRMDFEVSAGGASNISENQLSFHNYPNLASETRSARIRSGRFGWLKKYDIQFRNGWVIVTVKVKLLNMRGTRPAAGRPQPAVGSPLSTRLKSQYTREIVGYLSKKFYFHRQNCRRGDRCDCPQNRKCCKLRVQVRVRFVESGEHHTVRLYTGSGRANCAEWFRVKTRPNTYAHEVGHLLGWYDEYTGGATGPAPWHIHAAGIMNSGTRVEHYYYQDFKDWFAAKTNEPWTAIRT